MSIWLHFQLKKIFFTCNFLRQVSLTTGYNSKSTGTSQMLDKVGYYHWPYIMGFVLLKRVTRAITLGSLDRPCCRTLLCFLCCSFLFSRVSKYSMFCILTSHWAFLCLCSMYYVLAVQCPDSQGTLHFFPDDHNYCSLHNLPHFPKCLILPGNGQMLSNNFKLNVKGES